MRPYEPGDEKAWVDIHLEADELNEVCLDLFHDQFPGTPEELARRQFYLCENSTPVGTATAWRNALDGEEYGRVHWVAILPKLQGRGLARPLLSAVCLRLAELGHGRAYLTTNTLRVPAVNLYLKFSFRPWPRSDGEAEAWERLAASGALKYPAAVAAH